jgi:hypothetical protein
LRKLLEKSRGPDGYFQNLTLQSSHDKLISTDAKVSSLSVDGLKQGFGKMYACRHDYICDYSGQFVNCPEPESSAPGPCLTEQFRCLLCQHRSILGRFSSVWASPAVLRQLHVRSPHPHYKIWKCLIGIVCPETSEGSTFHFKICPTTRKHLLLSAPWPSAPPTIPTS